MNNNLFLKEFISSLFNKRKPKKKKKGAEEKRNEKGEK